MGCEQNPGLLQAVVIEVTHFLIRPEFEQNGFSALPGGNESVEVVAGEVGGTRLPDMLNALHYNGRCGTARAVAASYPLEELVQARGISSAKSPPLLCRRG